MGDPRPCGHCPWALPPSHPLSVQTLRFTHAVSYITLWTPASAVISTPLRLLLRRLEEGGGLLFLSLLLHRSRVSSSSSSASLVRLVLRRIRWLRSLPHHGGVLSGGAAEPMASSACRSFGAVGLMFPVSGGCRLSWRRRQVGQICAGTRLVAQRRQIWCSSLATTAGCISSGSRSAWGTSSADTPHRQAPVLQVWSSAHNAYKAMALAWILVCWCSASSLSVRLGGRPGPEEGGGGGASRAAAQTEGPPPRCVWARSAAIPAAKMAPLEHCVVPPGRRKPKHFSCCDLGFGPYFFSSIIIEWFVVGYIGLGRKHTGSSR